MNTHPSDHECRDISSSEDRCKCPLCKNQLEFQLFEKKPLPNIYHYRHIKRREPPPNKKDILKDLATKPKILFRLEAESRTAATPNRNKPDRSKEAVAGLGPTEYHMVSHSQRIKLTREGKLIECRRDERMRPKVRSNYEGLRLIELMDNSEAIKLVQRHTPSAERARVDASPNGGNLLKLEQEKQMTQK